MSIIPALALLLAIQVPAQAEGDSLAADADRPGVDDGHAVQEPLDPSLLASAFLDDDARRMVERARERRRLADYSLDGYRALARERFGIGVRALRRERLLFQRETATRVDWRRDGPVHLEVLGAREVLPAFLPAPRVPERLEASLPHLAFDPSDDRMLIGFHDSSFVRHPLAEGSEGHYRFESGDTTLIRLPDGRVITVLELRIRPRRPDVHLLRGSFWLESESHSLVRATFRLADDFDLARHGDDGDGSDIPRILRPVRGSVGFVTIEYGLWEMQWWLPRLVALEAVVQAGRMLNVPFRYERSYTEYQVTGRPVPGAARAEEGPEAARPAPGEPARPPERKRCRSELVVRVGIGAGKPDEAPAGDREQSADSARAANEEACQQVLVTVPADSAELLESPHLPPSAFQRDLALMSAGDLEDLRARIAELPGVPWRMERPTVLWGLGAGLTRFNRVEGLSTGLRVDWGLGPATASATARIGVADLEPNGEISLSRESARGRIEVGGFRRLESMDPAARPFTLGASASALFLGRDDAEFYRATGVELIGRPPAAGVQTHELRLFARKERPAVKETDFSVPHLLDAGRTFREVVAADPATLYGAAFTGRLWGGYDPVRLRGGAELTLDGSGGSYRFGRGALALTAGVPLPGRLLGWIEGAAGTSVGELPVQHLWRLGGAATLRGYPGSSAAGEAFWRARAEIGTLLPAVRLVAFSDAGWAGDRDAFAEGRALVSAGLGASVLDGLLRVDVARALRAPTGWSVTLWIDAGL